MREALWGERQRPHGGQESNIPWRQSLSEVFIESRVKGREEEISRNREEEEEEARTSLSYNLGLGRQHHLTLTPESPRKTHYGNCACALGAAPGFVSSHLRRYTPASQPSRLMITFMPSTPSMPRLPFSPCETGRQREVRQRPDVASAGP